MKDHLQKFVFLAVIVVVVLASRLSYPANSGAATADLDTQAQGATPQTVPLFTMPPATVSAPAGDGGTGPLVPATTTTPQPPALNDAAYLVADLATGNVFASFNPDRRWPTASLTKLMTATVAEDDMASDTLITITEPMFAVDPQDETTLAVGGTYTLHDLMYVLLLPSSNVAAEAIADFYGHDAFIATMNARAAAWGMTSTFFDDPSGLSAANQSTANDFLKLAEVVYNKYPQILAITRNPSVTIIERNSGRPVPVKSIDDFAGQPDFIGGKTGHTDQADGNLFSIFRDNGRPIFIVVLGTDDRFIDTQKLYAWFKANYN